MEDGLATYKRLKACLVLKDVTLTRFAVALGTTPQAVSKVVCRFAGTTKTPRSQISKNILSAVEVELREYDQRCTEHGGSEDAPCISQSAALP